MNTVIAICAKYLFVLIAPLFALVWFQSSASDRKTLVMRGAVLLIVGVLMAKGAGALYFEPRPFVSLHRQPLIPHEADNGFPSDHTLLVFGCAFLIFPFMRPMGIAAAGIGVLVASARVAALVHSPLDIVTSIGIAAAASLLAARLLPRTPREKPAAP